MPRLAEALAILTFAATVVGCTAHPPGGIAHGPGGVPYSKGEAAPAVGATESSAGGSLSGGGASETQEKEQRGNTPIGMDRQGHGPAAGAIVDPTGAATRTKPY